MADPFSISAFALSTAGSCLKLAEAIAKFVYDARDAPDSVSDFHQTISALHNALDGVGQVSKECSHTQHFEVGHRQNIRRIIDSCRRTLDRLGDELPELRDDPSGWDKARAALVLTLKSSIVQHLVANISSYSQVCSLAYPCLLSTDMQ